MNNLLIVFIILNIINVTGSTAKSILTINSDKYIASLANGIYFAFYAVVIIYMTCNLPLWQKCLVIFICNIIGVFIVKLIEEKSSKDKIWKIEALSEININEFLDNNSVEYYYTKLNKHYIYNIYSYTKEDSKKVKVILLKHKIKHFVYESISL